MRTAPGLRAATPLAGILAVLAAWQGPADASPRLIAVQDEVPPQLVVPRERIAVAYRVQVGARWDEWEGLTASATGTLYVRNDRSDGWTVVPLRRGYADDGEEQLSAAVPRDLITGVRVRYWAEFRHGTLRTRSPAAGPSDPDTLWVIGDATRIALGPHRFGRTDRPAAVVARARPDQVGFDTCADECGCCVPQGPQSFLVTPRRAVWLLDSRNSRVLIWRHRHPNHVARVQRLPHGSSDVAQGPAGSVYILGDNGRIGLRYRRAVMRVSAAGRPMWQQAIAAEAGSRLQGGPDGAVYLPDSDWFVFHGGRRPGSPWVPVATRAGRPITLGRQLARTRWTQPLPGGLQLAWATIWPGDGGGDAHEMRVGLIGRGGRLLHAWRITSSTSMGPMWAATAGVIGADPVIPITVNRRGRPGEHLILRLGPAGVRARLTLPGDRPPDTPYGEGGETTQVRIGPGPDLYRLGSHPDFGAAVYRFSLRPRRAR